MIFHTLATQTADTLVHVSCFKYQLHSYANHPQNYSSTLHVVVGVEELLQEYKESSHYNIPTHLRSSGFGLHPFLVHTALILPSGTRPWSQL